MKRLLKLLTLLTVLSTGVYGQGVQHRDIAIQNVSLQGTSFPIQSYLKAIPGAVITVCASPNTVIPCSPPLVNTLFSDSALTKPLPNPTSADINGNYQFYALPNTYTVTVTGFGLIGYSYTLTLTPSSAGFPTLAGNNTWTGTNIFNNTVTLGAGGTFTGSFAGNPNFTGNPSFVNTIVVTGTVTTVFDSNTAVTNQKVFHVKNLGGELFVGIDNSTGGAFGQGAYASVIFSGSNSLFLLAPSITIQNLKSAFLTSTSSSPAAGGVIRLASTDTINWRNNANSGDVALSKNVQDNLVWPNGLVLGNGSVLHLFKQASAAVTPVQVNAGTCAEQTFNPGAFSGFTTTDIVYISFSGGIATLAFPVNARVSGAGIIAVSYCNPTGGNITPAGNTLTVTSFQ